MKAGVLYFVPTNRIAGGTAPGSKDLKFMGFNTEPNALTMPVLKNMSDLAAELCDQHLDVGKTMGIRKVIIDVVETQAQFDSVTFLDIPSGNESSAGQSAFGAWALHTSQGPGDADYDNIHALWLSLEAPANFISDTSHGEFNHDQFLLINLNFKSKLVQTPPAGIKWTFASQTARETPGIYLQEDFGKVAFQTDEASWWVLDDIEDIEASTNVTPKWLSQDLRSQIAAGLVNQRVVLFFLPDGTSNPFYPYINEYHYLNGSVLRDTGDQRALYDIGGDGAWIGWLKLLIQFGYPSYQDLPLFPGSFPGSPWLTTPRGTYLGSLGLFDSFETLESTSFDPKEIGRTAMYKDEQGFPYDVGLISVSPNTFTDPNPPFWPTHIANIPVDHHFIYHALPDLEPPQNYGGTENPDIEGAFRVRPANVTGIGMAAQFKLE